MAIQMCSAGQIELLTIMLKTALGSSNDFTLKLYKNNYTPILSSVVGSFTECDFSGYSSVSLPRSGWGSASTVSTSASITYGSTPTWTCNGGTSNTVYGAFILDGSGNLVWAELFASAATMTNGDVLNYTPVFTLT